MMLAYKHIILLLVVSSLTVPRSARSASTDEEEMYSCRDRCGHVQQLPCSCDHKCLVHNTCCQDMSEECPQIVDESREKFHTLLQSTIKCHAKAIFVVTSCPHEQSTIVSKSSSTSSNIPGSPDDETDLHEKTLVSDSNESENEVTTMATTTMATSSRYILNIIDNTFVTDASTGFVFETPAISRCHASNNYDPVKWNIIFETKGNKASFALQNMEDLSNAIDLSVEPFYVLPTDVDPSLGGAPCFPDSIDKCPEDFGDKEHLVKCEAGAIAYIKAKFDFEDKWKIYRNKFCVECNFGDHFNVSTAPVTQSSSGGEREFTLSLLVSLSDDSSLKITAMELYPWQGVTCDLASDGQAGKEDKCIVAACRPGYERRPDNQCKVLTNVKFAVADNDYPVTPKDLESLPEFVRCNFERNLHMEVMIVDPMVTTVYDTTFQTKLHVVKMELFHVQRHTGYNPIVPKSPGQKDYLIRLSVIAKIFKQIRKQRAVLPLNDIDECKNSGHHDYAQADCASSSNENDTSHNHNLYYKSGDMTLSGGLFGEDWYRGVQTNETQTTVCICSYLLEIDDDCTLKCLHDWTYQQEEVIMSEFKNVCLSKKHQRNNSHEFVASVCGQCLLIAILSLLLLHPANF